MTEEETTKEKSGKNFLTIFTIFAVIAGFAIISMLSANSSVAISQQLVDEDYVPYQNASQTVNLNEQRLENTSYFEMRGNSSFTDLRQLDFFDDGSYYLPFFNSSDSEDIPFTAFNNGFIVIDRGGGTNSTQISLSNSDASRQARLVHDSSAKQFIFSPPTGVGYVVRIDEEVQIADYLRIGDNTADNLTTGDINASIIYYDALVAKSPMFECSSGDNWCKVTVPRYQKEFYFEHDGQYNIQTVYYEGSEYTPAQFRNTVCATNQRTQEACNKIRDKILKLQCETTGYHFFIDGQCLQHPILHCDAQSNSTWSFETNNCAYDAQKDCESQGDRWNPFTNVCVDYVAPPPTLEDQKQECLKNLGTVWYYDECISLAEYYE